MKSVLGFLNPEKQEELAPVREKEISESPVRSVAEVRFLADGQVYPYYNDRFDLEVGDMVFVTGKKEGMPGVVISVTRKFKVDLSYYQKILSAAHITLRGTFTPIVNMMVSTDSEASPGAELFRAWVKAPKTEEQTAQIVYGEGYELPLDTLEQDKEVKPQILDRAVDYCESGNVRFLSLRDGVGTAFVEGGSWYEVNFRYANRQITELYCECPYPGLCKHELAAAIVLRKMFEELNAETDFTAIEQRFFREMLSITRQKITL